MARVSKWWLSLQIAKKLGVVLFLALLIGLVNTGISIAALGYVQKATETALAIMVQNETGLFETQKQIDDLQHSVRVFLTLSNLGAAALIGLIIYAINKRFSADIGKLTGTLALIQKGHLDERVMINNTDEFGFISAAFNRLLDSIQDKNLAMSESEAHFNVLATASPNFIFVVQDGSFVYINPAGLEALNYAMEGLVGMPLLAVVHPEDRGIFQGWMQKLVRGDSPGPVEIRVLNGDGQTHLMEIVAASIIHDNKPALLGIGQDITRHRKMETTLIESEKLAGIGTLAAGIAHEINTPLQVITGYSGGIRRDIEASRLIGAGKLDQKIASIERNAWRIAAIVRSLLVYARPAADRAGSHSLNDIVAETLLLIEHQLNCWFNISIEKELAADLPALQCDSNRITQVLINLLTNAADAMPDGGKILLRTEFDEKDRQCKLQVSDTGAGIPEYLHSRIFDPFFTTKQVGEGTGLGLSISRGIVEAHGGVISLQSQVGEGASFTISLPQEPAEMAAAYAASMHMDYFSE